MLKDNNQAWELSKFPPFSEVQPTATQEEEKKWGNNNNNKKSKFVV